MIPGPWPFALLALAAYRVFWLIAEDDITAPIRERLTARGRREKTELFLTCGWCAGFWICVGWWLAWLALNEWAVVAAVPFALSAVVGLVTVTAHRMIGE